MKRCISLPTWVQWLWRCRYLCFQKRLDDTWQNWSEPQNPNNVNSSSMICSLTFPNGSYACTIRAASHRECRHIPVKLPIYRPSNSMITARQIDWRQDGLPIAPRCIFNRRMVNWSRNNKRVTPRRVNTNLLPAENCTPFAREMGTKHKAHVGFDQSNRRRQDQHRKLRSIQTRHWFG